MTPLVRAAVAGSRPHAAAPVVTDPHYASVMALLHGEGTNGSTTFTDNIVANVWTSAGGASITTAQFKFGAASMDFGSGDRATMPTTTRFGFAAGDYTVECWMRATDLSGSYRGIWDFRTATATVAPNLNLTTSGAIQFREAENNRITSATGVITLNTWHHVAVCRSGNNTRLFVDGVEVGTTYTTNNNLGSTAPLAIGCFGAGAAINDSFKFFGQLDEFRVTKGVARYTANFTAPTAAFPDYFEDEHTNRVSILTHFDGADAATSSTDSSKWLHALTFNGNAQIDTAQSKFGGSSLLLDGTGDFVSAPDSTAWDFDTGDFTVEAWVRFNSLTGSQIIVSHYEPSTPQRAWSLAKDVTTNNLSFGYTTTGQGGGDIKSTNGAWPGVATGTWFHVAACREGANLRLFVDGVQVNTTFNMGTDDVFNSNTSLRIGASGNSPVNFFNGWIDDVRVTKGVARYTANFTPPVAAFPNA